MCARAALSNSSQWQARPIWNANATSFGFGMARREYSVEPGTIASAWAFATAAHGKELLGGYKVRRGGATAAWFTRAAP